MGAEPGIGPDEGEMSVNKGAAMAKTTDIVDGRSPRGRSHLPKKRMLAAITERISGFFHGFAPLHENNQYGGSL
jgi:hypothetical protein